MGRRKRRGVPERRDRNAIGDRGRDLGAGAPPILRSPSPLLALFASLFLCGVEEGFVIGYLFFIFIYLFIFLVMIALRFGNLDLGADSTDD